VSTLKISYYLFNFTFLVKIINNVKRNHNIINARKAKNEFIFPLRIERHEKYKKVESKFYLVPGYSFLSMSRNQDWLMLETSNMV